MLLIAFKNLFKSEFLPKNPYFRLARSLTISNTQKEIIDNFEKVINLLKKTQINESSNKKFGIISIGEKQNIWGLPPLLEWLDPIRIEKLRFSLFDVLPDFETNIGEFQVHIVHTLGGGHILKSDFLEFPDSSSRPLEIASEVFLTGGNLYEAQHAFATYVYDDVVSLTNLKDLHLFKSLVFQSWDDEAKEMKKKTWSLHDMITKKSHFLDDVINQINKNERFYLRILIKGKMIDYGKNLEDLASGKSSEKKENYFVSSDIETRFQYYDTFKIYNLHYIDVNNGSKIESFEYQPLSSLMKVLFIDYFSKISCKNDREFFSRRIQP